MIDLIEESSTKNIIDFNFTNNLNINAHALFKRYLQNTNTTNTVDNISFHSTNSTKPELGPILTFCNLKHLNFIKKNNSLNLK